MGQTASNPLKWQGWKCFTLSEPCAGHQGGGKGKGTHGTVGMAVPRTGLGVGLRWMARSGLLPFHLWSCSCLRCSCAGEQSNAPRFVLVIQEQGRMCSGTLTGEDTELEVLLLEETSTPPLIPSTQGCSLSSGSKTAQQVGGRSGLEVAKRHPGSSHSLCPSCLTYEVSARLL